ncbi:hypothetical protein GUITHDRAFT_77483 [Guillardia theta CCMP2712]|uniref:Enoyl reductase (ER) domain-containing protein n=1 Tax=Guillardia theta (strain CCMP2712) TaxID=905079 RepID=L1IPE8_GUITC|nr:hypothetical protein GUITHDRAFT_77483 [Guillardia theta CCMP2712]EKX38138.1 hypothetical protein GUITHDRAFT_77483 [Guillardia theta CCMP2712]|eukprot:XP_005825118.1 hypothetical protein GUITHDRAFT_77483 [Guillardia theta CCMP2712]
MPKAGSLDQLRLEGFDESELQATEDLLKIEVRSSDVKSRVTQSSVQVKAIGLNFADIFACQGLYSATPTGSFVPGLEFSGIIVEVGADVKERDGWRPKAGERVMGVTRFGGYTTHLLTRSCFVRPIPSDWSYEEGAGFLCTSLTAWYGLVHLGGLKKDQHVLVHSAAGGVGLAALEIVLAHKAHPIATIGTASKASLLQARMRGRRRILGIYVTQERFNLPSSKIIEGIAIVMDSVQGPYFQPCYDRLCRGGRIVVFGAASMTPPGDRPNWIRLAWQWLRRPTVDPLEIIAANKGVLGFNLIWMWDKVEEMSEMLKSMLAAVPWKVRGFDIDLVASPTCQRPLVGKTYKMEDAADALRFLQSGQNVGKVVLVVNSGSS